MDNLTKILPKPLNYCINISIHSTFIWDALYTQTESYCLESGTTFIHTQIADVFNLGPLYPHTENWCLLSGTPCIHTQRTNVFNLGPPVSTQRTDVWCLGRPVSTQRTDVWYLGRPVYTNRELLSWFWDNFYTHTDSWCLYSGLRDPLYQHREVMSLFWNLYPHTENTDVFNLGHPVSTHREQCWCMMDEASQFFHILAEIICFV